MKLSYKQKAEACFASHDYKGYLENSRKQYKESLKDEDLAVYEKAKKVLGTSREIEDILASEGQCNYKILGVNQNSSIKEIKKAFVDKAAKYHPNICNIKGSQDAMRIILKAYFEINTEEKKNAYDNKFYSRSRHNDTQAHDFERVFRMYRPSVRFGYEAGPGFSFSTNFDEFDPNFGFGYTNRMEEVYSNIYRNAFFRQTRNMNGPSQMLASITIFIIFCLIILMS